MRVMALLAPTMCKSVPAGSVPAVTDVWVGAVRVTGASGVPVPMPKKLLELFQNSSLLFWLYVPDAPAKMTEPAVKAVDVPVPPLATGSVPVTAEDSES